MHDVGHQWHAGRRREQLARHRLADVPDLVVDDGPEYDARVAGQLERRAVHDRGILGALAGDHWVGHSGIPFDAHFLTPLQPRATRAGVRLTLHSHARLYAKACESTPFFERLWHPRLFLTFKTWMAGTSPAMTPSDACKPLYVFGQMSRR